MADEVRHTGPGEARTIQVPLAEATADGVNPTGDGGSGEPPRYTVVMWNDVPILYERVTHIKEP